MGSRVHVLIAKLAATTNEAIFLYGVCELCIGGYSAVESVQLESSREFLSRLAALRLQLEESVPCLLPKDAVQAVQAVQASAERVSTWWSHSILAGLSRLARLTCPTRTFGPCDTTKSSHLCTTGHRKVIHVHAYVRSCQPPPAASRSHYKEKPLVRGCATVPCLFVFWHDSAMEGCRL